MAGVKEIAKVTAEGLQFLGLCDSDGDESGALMPSGIFLSSVLTLPQQDERPQVLAPHCHHHQ